MTDILKIHKVVIPLEDEGKWRKHTLRSKLFQIKKTSYRIWALEGIDRVNS
jgi:hypothetical protein